MTTAGSCHCGKVRYEVESPVTRFAHCHCQDCRKMHGTTFGSALVLPSTSFRLTAGEENLTAYESSPGKFRCFCKTCGAHIYARMDYQADRVIVRAGTLDGDPGVRPQMHIWVKDKAPWYEIQDNLPQHMEGFVAAK